MDIRINTTLKEKLFENPKPIEQKAAIYTILFNRMFPCPKVFSAFLSTSDMSEKIEQAKYIVQRLCFESNFPPPYSLLMNLEEYETADINKSKSKVYVAQDHFCHLVYLYLLGIYLFFYVPIINKNLTNEYIGNREESQFDLALDAAKDFISFWKYFCLYHDLAYPIEQVRGVEEILTRKLEERINIAKNQNEKKELDVQLKAEKKKWEDLSCKYLRLFDEIHPLIRRELTLEGGTKLLVIWQLMNDPSNKLTIENIVNRTRNMSSVWTVKGQPLDENQDETMDEISNQKILALFSKYTIIDKLHNYEQLKMLSGFIENKTYLSVLFNSETEQPVAIRKKCSVGTTYLFMKDVHIKVTNDEAQQYLDSEEPLLDSHYYIRYFFDPSVLKTTELYLIRSPRRKFNNADYNTLIEIITENFDKQPETDMRFSNIATDEDLSTYIFHLYRAFSSLTNSIYDPHNNNGRLPEDKTSTKICIFQRRIEKYLDDQYYKVFEEAISEKIARKYKDIAQEIKDNLKSDLDMDMIRDSVHSLVETAFKKSKIDTYKEDIEKQFNLEISNALEKEKNNSGLLIDFIFSCERSLFMDLQSVDEKVWKQRMLIAGQDKTTILMEELNSMLSNDTDYQILRQDLNKRFTQSMKITGKKLPGLEQFISKYELSYTTCDHGLYGSLIFILCSRYYRELIEQLFASISTTNAKADTIKAVMSTLCWNVEKAKYENKLRNNYTQIIRKVFGSIFYHNIYPREIRRIYKKDSCWKYDFSEEPSIYFGMLTDALQVWNRPKYYMREKLDWWPSFSSDFYNIAVRNNTIFLEIKNYDSQISEIEKTFVRNTEEYLSNFSAFVKIGRIES